MNITHHIKSWRQIELVSTLVKSANSLLSSKTGTGCVNVGCTLSKCNLVSQCSHSSTLAIPWVSEACFAILSLGRPSAVPDISRKRAARESLVPRVPSRGKNTENEFELCGRLSCENSTLSTFWIVLTQLCDFSLSFEGALKQYTIVQLCT